MLPYNGLNKELNEIFNKLAGRQALKLAPSIDVSILALANS